MYCPRCRSGGRFKKNRIEVSDSLPHFLQGNEPFPAEGVITHYANKAKAGAAIVTCMGINNFSRGMKMPMQADFTHFADYDLYDPACRNDLMQPADAAALYYDSMFRAEWKKLPNFRAVPNASVLEIGENTVVYADRDGVRHSLPCDTVVPALGMQARTEEAPPFYGSANRFAMVGDVKKPATVQQAMRSAYAVGRSV